MNRRRIFAFVIFPIAVIFILEGLYSFYKKFGQRIEEENF